MNAVEEASLLLSTSNVEYGRFLRIWYMKTSISVDNQLAIPPELHLIRERTGAKGKEKRHRGSEKQTKKKS
jgi:hypothetical protein